MAETRLSKVCSWRAAYRGASTRCGRNVSAAARELQMSRASLDYRLGNLGLRPRGE